MILVGMPRVLRLTVVLMRRQIRYGISHEEILEYILSRKTTQ